MLDPLLVVSRVHHSQCQFRHWHNTYIFKLCDKVAPAAQIFTIASLAIQKNPTSLEIQIMSVQLFQRCHTSSYDRNEHELNKGDIC